MPENKSPAFQFYPKDFLTDAKVIIMPPEIRGLYITLLCIDWLEDGFPKEQMLPLSGFVRHDQNGNLRDELSHSSAIAQLSPCFMAHPSKVGYLTNPRLRKERIGQEHRRLERVESGKKGAISKWNRDLPRMALPSSCHGSAILLPMAQPMANDGSSSSSTPSSSDPKNFNIIPKKVLSIDLQNIVIKSMPPNPEASVRDVEQTLQSIERIIEKVEPPKDDLMIIAESWLSKPNGTEPWEKTNSYMLAGRRPLREFPELFFQPHELRSIFKQFKDSGLNSEQFRIGLQMGQAELTSRKAAGKPIQPDRIPNWFLGWIPEKLLDLQIKKERLSKAKAPYEHR